MTQNNVDIWWRSSATADGFVWITVQQQSLAIPRHTQCDFRLLAGRMRFEEVEVLVLPALPTFLRCRPAVRARDFPPPFVLLVTLQRWQFHTSGMADRLTRAQAR